MNATNSCQIREGISWGHSSSHTLLEPEDRKPQGAITTPIIHTETQDSWLKSPISRSINSASNSSAMLSRWVTQTVAGSIDLTLAGGDETHTLTLCLSPKRGELECGGRWIHRGAFPTNSLWIKAPYEGARAIYSSGYSVFRVHLPQSLIRECYEGIYGRYPTGEVILSKSTRCNDLPLNDLIQTLIGVDDVENVAGQTFLDGISLAIVSRLIALDAKCGNLTLPRKGTAPLAKWRLKRTIEYVDANLSTSICLAQLSEVAGLSRMYFAAQFRAATGYSPNQYILRRRVSRAQELLRHSTLSIVEVALLLGFQSQAHFTVIFRGIVGETPAKWRRGATPE